MASQTFGVRKTGRASPGPRISHRVQHPRSSPRSSCASCAATPRDVPSRHDRRSLLHSLALASAACLELPADAKKPKGFQTVRDTGDGYEFLFPFGWQEVSVTGIDTVYKDVIEPLESVAVQLVPTDKASIADYGPTNEVAGTLASTVLANPNDEVKLIKSESEVAEARDYITFEFLQQSRRFSRHVLACATVANGKLMLFSTGSSQKRWDKMEEKLLQSVRSFKAFNVY